MYEKIMNKMKDKLADNDNNHNDSKNIKSSFLSNIDKSNNKNNYSLVTNLENKDNGIESANLENENLKRQLMELNKEIKSKESKIKDYQDYVNQISEFDADLKNETKNKLNNNLIKILQTKCDSLTNEIMLVSKKLEEKDSLIDLMVQESQLNKNDYIKIHSNKGSFINENFKSKKLTISDLRLDDFKEEISV